MSCLDPPTRTGFPVFSSVQFSASLVSAFQAGVHPRATLVNALLVRSEDLGTRKEGSHVALPLCARPAQSVSANILVFARRVGGVEVGAGASNRCNQNEDKIRVGCKPKTQMEKENERLLSSRF